MIKDTSPVRFRVKGESSVCGNSKKICVKVFQGKSLSLDFAMVLQVGKLGNGNLNKAIADGLQDTKAPFDKKGNLMAKVCITKQMVKVRLDSRPPKDAFFKEVLI